MFFKKIKVILLLLLFYQSPVYSKSTTFDDLKYKNLSLYFSGIVAFDNKNNSKALNFFNSSKILINKHDPYLKRYVYSLVLENKVSTAINVIKSNKEKKNFKFFDANLLLILDDLKKKKFNEAYLRLADLNLVEAALTTSLIALITSKLFAPVTKATVKYLTPNS